MSQSATGSSGAGTTSVSRTFQQIFRREGIEATFVEGDAFHRYDRAEMAQRMAEESTAGNHAFSHFASETNVFEDLEALYTLACRSGKMDLAMQLISTPMVWRLMEQRRQALARL